jgi:hypothetical protein
MQGRRQQWSPASPSCLSATLVINGELQSGFLALVVVLFVWVAF